MAISRQYRVLFFIAGITPTPQQRSEALNFGPHVAFRNASYIVADDNPEDCDAVYGPAVPASYTARYPWACSIVDFYNGKLSPVAVAPAVPADEPPVSGAGDPATFDPFAAVNAQDRERSAWKPQG